MEQMLDSVEQTRGFILRRVRAYESMESIEQQINTIVNEIQELLKEREIEPWDIDKNPVECVIKKKKIVVEDRLQFDKIITICKCLGKNYKGMQKCFFPIGYEYYILCPKLAVVINGETKSVAKDWINTLSDDWNTIYEENENIELLNRTSHNLDIPMITFAKSKDVLGRNRYRFIGVFRYDAIKSNEIQNVYTRVATEIGLNRWLN